MAREEDRKHRAFPSTAIPAIFRTRACVYMCMRARLFRRDTNLNENVDPSWVLEEGEIL